jgi:hypothetical protein
LKLVYICSPYQNNPEENIRNALLYCKYAAEQNVVPIAPHTIYTKFLSDKIPSEREKGLQMGLELLRRCEEVWACGDEITQGMKAEIAEAMKYDIPIKEVSKHKISPAPVFTLDHCIPNSDTADYENQLVILKPEVLKEEYRNQHNQLWIAQNGFGMTFGAKGQSVFAECLHDGEHSRWQRSNFLGIADKEKLPEWALNQLNERETEEMEVN